MHLRITEVNPADVPENQAHPLRELLKTTDASGVSTAFDPDGVEHRFTFDMWKNRDPDETYLAISFIHYNPQIYGSGRIHPSPQKGAYEL
jgi:hypothetical protein